jgi:hypothetical protein
MEGVRRGPPNAVRHHGEEKEEETNFNLHPNGEKFIQIYLAISKALIICNSKENAVL